jgi:two-component system chemotaxis response regulator CheY
MSRKIMIVDDSALSRRTLRRILETAAFDVIEATDGMAALEMYFLEKPDAVLLDLVMSGMYGLEVLKKLREMDGNAKIIIASADIQSSTRILAEEGGAVAIINKPLIASEVISILEQALSGGKPLGTN